MDLDIYTTTAVSYTHLDVYKRQVYGWPSLSPFKTVEIQLVVSNRLSENLESMLNETNNDPSK